jgi:hypothetical protein
VEGNVAILSKRGVPDGEDLEHVLAELAESGRVCAGEGSMPSRS